jgi:hypothetical protein
MAGEPNIPIAQVIHNYITNLPTFPPADPELLQLHERMLALYTGFLPAALASAIPESEQGKVLERAQKTLWSFGRAGRLEQDNSVTALVLDRQAAQNALKFPRPEETLSLLARLGMPVEYGAGGGWNASGKLRGSEALRLRFDLSPALQKLAASAAASSPKEKITYERFLRVNPQAKVAREKPPLNLPPDAPAILANLPSPAAEAWQRLVRYISAFDGYSPTVEFRSIHHGMWTANYDATRGSRDLCGLAVQNGEMTVRIILYRAGHIYVKERLDEFGDVIASAFRSAHYYEEFEHQWLFIPVRRAEDLAGIERLLAVMPALLKPLALSNLV